MFGRAEMCKRDVMNVIWLYLSPCFVLEFVFYLLSSDVLVCVRKMLCSVRSICARLAAVLCSDGFVSA